MTKAASASTGSASKAMSLVPIASPNASAASASPTAVSLNRK
jgi:hypothetical protein